MTQTIDLESELLPSAAVFYRMKLELLDRLDEAALVPVPVPAPVHLAPRKHRPVRRRVIGASTLLAAAVIATLVATNIAGPHGATAEAAEVLHSAALASIHSSDPVVGPGQYLMVDTTEAAMDFGDHAAYVQPHRRLLYVPFDRDSYWVIGNQALPPGAQYGDASGLIKDYWGPRANGVPVGTLAYIHAQGGKFISAPLDIAEIAALPRDPDALHSYLYSHVTGQLSKDQEVWGEIYQLLIEGLVPANLRASMYDVLARIPGVYLAEGNANLDGRTGVGISFLDSTGIDIQQIIIDPKTGLVIGTRDLGVKAAGKVPAGVPLDWSAVTTTVVDSAPTGPFLKEHQPG
jgi:hypothetical protein